MSLRQLLPKGKPSSLFPTPRHSPSNTTHSLHRPRFQSTNPPPNPQAAKQRARIDRVLSRVPKYLRPYTDGLRNAPVSHVVAFLILHEITAIVPLVGLAGLFHYANWLPSSLTEGKYIREGIEKFGRYFRRKGWFGFDKESVKIGERGEVEEGEEEEGKLGGTGRGSRILVEVATAYAVTKVLLPVRILGSVWATPWFARVFVRRIGGGVRKVFGRGGGAAKSSGAVGTGATGADVVGKGVGKGPS